MAISSIRNNKGFTLIEALITFIILVIGIVIVAQVVGKSMDSVKYCRQSIIAARLAHAELEKTLCASINYRSDIACGIDLVHQSAAASIYCVDEPNLITDFDDGSLGHSLSIPGYYTFQRRIEVVSNASDPTPGTRPNPPLLRRVTVRTYWRKGSVWKWVEDTGYVLY